MHYLYNDKIQVDGLINCSNNIGIIIDWFIGVKGQSIKVEFDDDTTCWINVYDKTLKITKLESLTI